MHVAAAAEALGQQVDVDGVGCVRLGAKAQLGALGPDLVSSGFPLDVTTVGGINNAGQIVLTGTVPIIGAAAIVLTPKDVSVGDLDKDCCVGIVDFLRLLSAWGSCDEVGDCPAAAELGSSTIPISPIPLSTF